MGALVNVPIQEIAQTVLQPPSAIDAVHEAGNAVADPQGTQPSAAIPILLALALGAWLL